MPRTLFLVILTLLISCLGQSAFAQVASPNLLNAYRLGSGDAIHVNVFDEPDLGGDFNVSGDGKISLPLIGDTVAAGRTVSELQDAIAAAYSGRYLRDPKVNIQVTKFRPFYIYGEVGKPGEYAFSSGITVLNAVALAEGFTYRANKKKVFIRRVNESQETEVPITSDLLVEPGETLRIAERHF
jgi:protein involved in polysaccharide export with SLBB domain